MSVLKSLVVAAFIAAAPAVSISGPAEQRQPIGSLEAADPAALAEFKKEIRALYDLKEKAFAEGDAEAIVNHFYSADAVTVGPDGKPAMDRAAFLENYRTLVEKYNVRVESVKTHVNGESGWDWTNFHVASKDGSEPPFTFIILFLWNKIDGKWACPGDMYVVGSFQTMR